MRTLNLVGSALFAAMFLGGCASLGPKLDSPRMAKVKKVVVLSFEIQQQHPADNLGVGALKGERAADSPELKAMAKDTYSLLTLELSRTLGKSVIGYEGLKSQSSYKGIYHDKMEGVSRKTFMGNSKYEVVFADGILDDANGRMLSHEQKVQLAKSVGADAYATFVIIHAIQQSSYSLGHIFGGGDFSYVARSNLQVYDFSSPEPIWRIQNVDGEESPKASSLGEIAKLEKISRLGKESSMTSLKNLSSRYSKN